MGFLPSDLPLTPRRSCTVRPGTSCARVLAGSLKKALGSEVLQKAGAMGTHARQGRSWRWEAQGVMHPAAQAVRTASARSGSSPGR